MPIRLFVCLTMFLVVAAVTCAGQHSSVSTKSATGQTKKEIVTVYEPATSYEKVGQAEISYFAGSDMTEIRTEWPVYQGNGISASMWFVLTTKGRSQLHPKVVAVNFGLSGEKAKLEKLTAFVMEVDDKSVDLGGPTVDGIGYDLNAKWFFRHMHGSISFAAFENLVNSRSVRLRSGDIVFELSKNNRNALRDMLRAVRQHSNHPS